MFQSSAQSWHGLRSLENGFYGYPRASSFFACSINVLFLSFLNVYEYLGPLTVVGLHDLGLTVELRLLWIK